MWSAEHDARLRREAIAWLTVRTNDGQDPLSTSTIRNEFTFDGERFALMDMVRGIRKPKQLGSALSIRTVWRPAGAARPYEDDLGTDGLFRYKQRDDERGQSENEALRAAMRAGQALIWFWGVGQALYQAIFPIYLIGEEEDQRQFVVATDGLQHLKPTLSPVEEVYRRYVRAETTRRLHQPVFRGMVMRAYDSQCAVCSLRHPSLLDAAHIVEDKHELGIAAVRNGLSLCKIHHAAYDAGVMGIDPDQRIHVRADILEEVDGPLLEHGIKALHGSLLRVVPSARSERPDSDLLAQHFERFLAS